LILGIGSGFQALLRLGLLPYGEIRELDSQTPALVINSIGRHVSAMVQTRVASVLSPGLLYASLAIFIRFLFPMWKEGLQQAWK